MEDKSPVEFFHLFFTEDVMELVFEESKRYIELYLQREREYMERHPFSRAHEWMRTPLVKKELDILLALIIAMGACGFPTLRCVRKYNISYIVFVHVCTLYCALIHVYCM